MKQICIRKQTCGCWLDSTYTLCKRQWSYSESLSFMGDNDRTTDSIHLLEVKLVVKTTNIFKIVTQVLPAMLLTIAKLTQSHGDTTTDHPTFANGLCQEQLPLCSKTNRRCTLVLLISTTAKCSFIHMQSFSILPCTLRHAQRGCLHIECMV